MNNAYASNELVNKLISIVVELVDDTTSRRFLSVIGYMAGIFYMYKNGVQIPFNILVLAGIPLTVWIIAITIRDIVTTIVTKQSPEIVTIPTTTTVTTPTNVTTTTTTAPVITEVPEVGNTTPVETTVTPS